MKKLILLFVIAAFMFSCRSQSLIQPGDSLEVAYEKAYSLFEEEKWSDAASAFETVISIGRGTEFGRDAQFYLAESYFNNRRYMLAASEYERYSSNHPNSERRQEVDFKAATSYYQMSPRFNIDQTNTHRAIERFNLFLARYPNSEMADEAGDKIAELRNKLARKNYEAAEFYMRTNRYNAAAVYHDIILDRYPDSDYAERALYRQIDAYIRYAENSVTARQEERFEKAVDSYETYVQLFPRGENREQAEQLYERAMRALYNIRGDEEETFTATGS